MAVFKTKIVLYSTEYGSPSPRIPRLSINRGNISRSIQIDLVARGKWYCLRHFPA